MHPLSKILILSLSLSLTACAGANINPDPPVPEPPAAERYTQAFYNGCMSAIKLFGKPMRLQNSAHDFCWCNADYSSRKFAANSQDYLNEWTATIAASERIGGYIVKELIKSHPKEILLACAGEPDAGSNKQEGRKSQVRLTS